MNFIDFKIIDAIDIIVVALLMWQIYRAIRGTAALTIFTGIFSLYLLWVVVNRILKMELLSMILGQVIGIGALALLIVFQPEVRRYLLAIGNRYATTQKGFFTRLFSGKKAERETRHIEEIAKACFSMSSTKTGALIAFEHTGDLGIYASTGDMINADVSKRLVENVFFKNAPLHDGAMIIKGDRIWAARCILPSSDNPHIPAHLGMRHRAAVGLTEHSDAIVVVVSEETGTISVVEQGKIEIVRDHDKLVERLTFTD